MAFTVNDYHDLVRLLAEHPEWRPELRRLVLTDELLTLPEVVRELAEAQRRTETRLEELAEAQKRTEAQLAALANHVLVLAENLKQATDRLGRITDDVIEWRYREHVAGYFGRWLRRAQVVPLGTIEESLEASLSHEELLEVLRLDLLVSGQLRTQPDTPPVWLAIEVAAVVDEADVERAQRRATLLWRAGYRALPAVAGEVVTLAAEARARTSKVVVVQNGQGFLWDESLPAWLVD